MAVVFTLLLCLLAPCFGLERIFETSEITIPRRLLPKVDDSTDSLLYAITFGVEKHFIYLEKQSFIPANFRLYLNGRIHASPRDLQPLKSDCYYQGYVLDSPSSAATLMTCNGLRGLVEFYNVSYVIEPFLFMHDFKHLLHRLSSMGKDDLLFTDSDTDPLSNRTMQQHIASHGHAARPVGQMLRFIEMAMFVTKDLYDSFGSSLSTITNNMVLLVSYLNTRFIPLDIRIFMVSLDVWTDSDQVDLVNGTTSKKLDRFLSWIHWNWPKPNSYDIPVLFSYDSSMGRGLTFFGGMCSQRNGALIVYPRDQGIDKFSVLVAHMLGHNIGLMHDNSRDCQCSGSACIMNTNIGNVFGAATFSSCSIADFAKFISAFGATCILKEPVVRVPFNPRICGNKILDDGEDCDCGTAAECSADPCCESNCKLKEDAQCAWGACCTNCQVLPEGTLCREADDECDLSEYCDGISNFCPDDFFQQNGNACSDHKWHCYKGTCRNPDSQCKKLFGGGSHAADTSCFVQANVQHDRFGNCGSDVKGSYFGCTAEHAMCGKLQCAYMNRLPLTSAKAPIIYYSPKSSICMSIDVSRNSDFRDTAFVLDGTKCGDDKICVKHKCVQISTLEKLCSEDSTCSGHGLCNNKGNCHCFLGWAPPTCIGRGTGGSTDSGSPRVEFERENDDSDYPLIIGLSIGLPLLFVIIVTVLIKSGTFKCARKSETYESDSEGRANSTTRNSPASSYRSV